MAGMDAVGTRLRLRRLLHGQACAASWLWTTRLVVGVFWLALAVATHLPQLRIEHDRPLLLRSDLFVHFGAFALLTVGLAAARPAGASASRRTSATTAVIVVALYALLDEWTQSWVGRVVAMDDVLVSLIGVAAAAGAMSGATAGGATPPTCDAATSTRDGSREPSSAAGRGFVRNAAVVGGLTFVSRLTGLVRDAVLAAALGLSSVADAFFIGFLVPNLFRRLFGEGALTAAFIPHYTDLMHHDPTLARRFASLWLAVLLIGLSLVTLAGEAALLGLSTLEWSEHTSLALRYTMVMLPYMPTICLVALIGAMLQVHGRFGPAAAAPVLLNLVTIAATLLGGYLFTDLSWIAMLVAISVLVAGVVQLAWQLIALLRVDRLTMSVTGTGPAFRATLAMMGPMLVGLAVFQINSFLDSVIAFALAGPGQFTVWGRPVAYPMDAGAVAALQWAQRLYQFPLGVFGIAVATAIFPALAHAAAEPARFRTTLQQGLRLTMFIGLPASVGLILVRVPLSRVIYERGQFTLDDAGRVGTILAGYAAAVWAYSMTHVLTRAFYARKDAATPLRISMKMVALNFALNLTLIWHLGAAGLAWATATSSAMQVLLMLRAARRHVKRPIDAGVCRAWGRTAGATAAMAMAIAPLLWLFPPMTLTRGGAALQLAAMVGIGALVYAAVSWLASAPELRLLTRRRDA